MILCNEFECIICLENIEIHLNEYISLECCNKQMHIHCLCKWIKSSGNHDKFICPYCRQKSIICNDIYNSLNHSDISNISHNIDFRNTNIDNNEYLYLRDLQDNTCNLYICTYKIYAIVFTILMILILFH